VRTSAPSSWSRCRRRRRRRRRRRKGAKKEAPAAKEEASTMPEVGAKLEAKFTDGKMYKAEVIQVSTAKKRKSAPVKVHYTGYGEDEDMWVALDDLKMPKGKKGKKDKKAKAEEPAPSKDEVPVPQPGMRLQATFEADGKFYVAEVLEVGVKVHYLGYGADEDAWVPLSKVKSKALKKK
jgi:hypothetical protein